MKFILSSILLVFTLIACETVIPTETAYGKIERENGNLSKIMKDGKLYIEIIRDVSGKIIETKQYNGLEKEPMIEKYSYNSDGQIIKREYSKTLADVYIYKDGRLIEMYSTNSNNPDWGPKLVYHYNSNGRIVKADRYFRDKKSGYIVFEYDKSGNTISRKEYLNEFSDNVFGEHRCTYDNQKNPFQNPSLYPLDMVQNNNVTSSYYYILYMSSMPVTKILSYTYNKDKLPVSFSTYIKENPHYSQEKFTYVYN